MCPTKRHGTTRCTGFAFSTNSCTIQTPNLTNVLIGTDWKIYRIDFTSAFRRYNDLRHPKNLTRCDRRLLEKLRALDGNEVQQRTKGDLTKWEVQAVMARRDKIVAYFQRLVAEKGENEVLY